MSRSSTSLSSDRLRRRPRSTSSSCLTWCGGVGSWSCGMACVARDADAGPLMSVGCEVRTDAMVSVWITNVWSRRDAPLQLVKVSRAGRSDRQPSAGGWWRNVSVTDGRTAGSRQITGSSRGRTGYTARGAKEGGSSLRIKRVERALVNIGVPCGWAARWRIFVGFLFVQTAPELARCRAGGTGRSRPSPTRDQLGGEAHDIMTGGFGSVSRCWIRE